MSGLGSSIYTTLNGGIQQVLQPEGDSTPVATRICCTIGPQSRRVDVLEKMLVLGMKIARFDFTYGDLAFHLESFKNLREAMRSTNTLCAVMLNPAGPDIHVLNRQDGQKIQLTAGAEVRLTNDASVPASSSVLPVNWPGSFVGTGLSVGSTVFVGQYLFSGAETTSAYLTVRMVEDKNVLCVVNNNCTLEGVHLLLKMGAGAHTPLPCLSEKDEAMLTQWAQATADSATGKGAGEFLSLPRTRNAADVASARAMLKRVGLGHMDVMAKIEDMQGLVNHAEVLSAADAVLFARGSLGTCMEPEKVFLAQKMLLHLANSQGKPALVTRIVDSMTDAPRPTRAEATDVANLVLDGADGILLGSETFRGKYVIDVVKTVASICRAAERVFDNYAFYRAVVDAHGTYEHGTTMDRAEALASSAVRAAHKMAAKLIVVFTVTGRTARLLAKFKPSQPLLTVVCTDPSSAVARFSTPETGRGSSPPPPGNGNGNGIKKVGSDTLLDSQQLSSWNHDAQAKRCLVYRGAVPIMADAPSNCDGGDLLQAVLDYAKSINLVNSGDRVVVSQCPRTMNSQVMSEAGVVQLVTVDTPLDSTVSTAKI